MLLEYIQEALNRARYEIIDDKKPYYGEVPELSGVWASGKSLEECRENLREVIEGWLIVRFQKDLPIPALGGKRLSKAKGLRARA